ncbi:hypothetical protein [Rhizobium freirei]|uniref:hypothetical protein n=1 Tax=Rhizobium freirei TaxID=1353277 RepID=UPI0012F9EA0B|nr:hypothetical protein [Rhizobium freirei]
MMLAFKFRASTAQCAVDDPFGGTLSTALHRVMKASVDEMIPSISRQRHPPFAGIAHSGKFFKKTGQNQSETNQFRILFASFFAKPSATVVRIRKSGGIPWRRKAIRNGKNRSKRHEK